MYTKSKSPCTWEAGDEKQDGVVDELCAYGILSRAALVQPWGLSGCPLFPSDGYIQYPFPSHHPAEPVAHRRANACVPHCI